MYSTCVFLLCRSVDAGVSTLNFDIQYASPRKRSCQDMAITQLLLFIDDTLQKDITEVTLGGNAVTYAVDYKGAEMVLTVCAPRAFPEMQLPFCQNSGCLNFCLYKLLFR